MRTDDASELSALDPIRMIADGLGAVIEEPLYRAVVQIPCIRHHNRHGKINAAAGKNTMIFTLMRGLLYVVVL